MTDLENSSLTAFFDDAAVFPPGSAPLEVAVRQHLQRRMTPLTTLTGPLLLPLSKVSKAYDLAVTIAGEIHCDLVENPLEIGLIVPVGELATAFEISESNFEGIQFTGLELKTSLDSWPRELEALQQANTPLARHAEFNSQQITQGALSALQDSNVDLKVRTGGLEARLFPTTDELAHILAETVRRKIPFKLTAGLHQGLRHTNPETGLTHHGFINIAIATHAATGEAEVDEISRYLAITDPTHLASLIRDIPTESWRTWFRSFGTCSIDEPLESLEDLGIEIEDFTTFGLGAPMRDHAPSPTAHN